MSLHATDPDFAALSDLLGQKHERVPPILLIKRGTGVPIFMAHGLGDTVLSLYGLARRMRVVNPIYGMQARGVDTIEEPHDTVQKMAEYFLDAIRRLQADGPYRLIGYSLGGLVAMEIARRLAENGQGVALLAMLDSYPDRHYLSTEQHIRLAVQRGRVRLAEFLRRGSRGSASSHPDVAISPRMQEVKQAQARALRSYRPRYYDGNVKFVQAGVPTFFPRDAIATWARFIKDHSVDSVPCDHFSMLTTHVDEVASILSRYVAETM